MAAIAVAAALMQLFPAQANLIKWAVIGLAILYLVIRASLTYPRIYRERKARAAQRLADDRQYERYEGELAAIRAKYSDVAETDEIGSRRFRTELEALHSVHAAMLERKFGGGRLVDHPLASQSIPTPDQGIKG